MGLATLAAGGCQTRPRRPVTNNTQQEQIRVNCYGLLYELLGKQSNVDKLLLIKIESDELDELITAIADASLAGADRLEEFSKKDPALPLDRTLLPPGETATRDAIASAKKKELLEPFNPGFESELLMTQAEALSYAWHLAGVAAENEPDAERAAYLKGLGEQMKDLHRRTITLLRETIRASAKPA
jgi:hypothetical protein